MTYTEYAIGLRIRIIDPDGTVLAENEIDGYDYITTDISAALTVTGHYQTCVAEFWASDGYYSTGYKTRDFYLTMLDLTINTFIPENHYPIPFSSHTAEGDDRGFSRSGSFRSNDVASIYAPAAGIDLIEWQSPAAGLAQVFDFDSSVGPDNRLTNEAWNDWILDDEYLKVYAAQPGTESLYCTSTKHSLASMTLQCQGNASSPYFAWSPGITYDFNVQFWFNANGTIDYLVQGGHDAFPNYEVYVGDQRLYEWDHGGWDIGWLVPPEDITGIFEPGRID